MSFWMILTGQPSIQKYLTYSSQASNRWPSQRFLSEFHRAHFSPKQIFELESLISTNLCFSRSECKFRFVSILKDGCCCCCSCCCWCYCCCCWCCTLWCSGTASFDHIKTLWSINTISQLRQCLLGPSGWRKSLDTMVLGLIPTPLGIRIVH